MRRIVLSIAASLDGFIARRDGGIDWLPSLDAGQDYGMTAFLAGVDTIVWGRTTWDQAQQLGGAAPFGEGVRHVVMTRRFAVPQPNVAFTDEPAASLARRLRAEPGKDVWLMGGGQVIAAFLDAGEVDEIVVHVIPILLGSGVPLAPVKRDVRLRSPEARTYPDGVVMLRYAVERAGDSGSHL